MFAVANQVNRFEFGGPNDPYFTNATAPSNIWIGQQRSAYLAYNLNANYLATFQDGCIYPGTETFSNNNTYVWQRPMGGADSSTRLLCLANWNGVNSNMTITTSEFYGNPATTYIATEVFSGAVIATFTRSFSYTVAAEFLQPD